MGFGEIYVVRAALFPPSGLSQRCVNSDPTILGKGQLSLLGSIRSEENTKRGGKSGLKWRRPGEYVSNRPSSGCVSVCIQHVHRRDRDPPLPLPRSPRWAEQACKVMTELNGAQYKLTPSNKPVPDPARKHTASRCFRRGEES